MGLCSVLLDLGIKLQTTLVLIRKIVPPKHRASTFQLTTTNHQPARSCAPPPSIPLGTRYKRATCLSLVDSGLVSLSSPAWGAPRKQAELLQPQHRKPTTLSAPLDSSRQRQEQRGCLRQQLPFHLDKRRLPSPPDSRRTRNSLDRLRNRAVRLLNRKLLAVRLHTLTIYWKGAGREPHRTMACHRLLATCQACSSASGTLPGK